MKVFASGDRVLLFGTILLVFVILIAVYRSPVMAILPLAAVGVAMRLAESVGALRRVDSPLWEKISSFVEARPKAVFAGALALLIVLSAGLVGYKESDTLLLIPLVLGIIGLVLGLLLRSILAPVCLVATLALSFVATVGLTTFIAVPLQGDSGIGNRVTAYILVFLTALGVDYTIFLMSRVRQELAHSGMREALRTSLVRTGGVVSSAGLILAATFSVLMTQPIRELYQFGLALALGILLDTFVVFPLLVPAIVRLIGDRALWPIAPAKSDAPADDGKTIRASA